MIRSETLELSSISKLLNTNATRSHLKGELMSRRNPHSQKYEKNLWILESKVEKKDDIYEHLANLLKFIENNLDKLNGIVNQCEFEISLGIFIKGENAGFYLDKDIMQRLNKIPIELFFDIYFNE